MRDGHRLTLLDAIIERRISDTDFFKTLITLAAENADNCKSSISILRKCVSIDLFLANIKRKIERKRERDPIGIEDRIACSESRWSHVCTRNTIHKPKGLEDNHGTFQHVTTS